MFKRVGVFIEIFMLDLPETTSMIIHGEWSNRRQQGSSKGMKRNSALTLFLGRIINSSSQVSFHCVQRTLNCIYISRIKDMKRRVMQVERNHNEGLWVTLRVGFSRRIVIDDWAIRSSWGLNNALNHLHRRRPLLIMIFHWRTKWCMTIYEMDELKRIKFNLLRRRWWAKGRARSKLVFQLY